MWRWGLVALFLVVLLGGSATAARSSERATGNSFSIKSRFRVDFTGTNTVQWTLTPGSSCSATGSGRQQIRIRSAGRAADRTIRLELVIYYGKLYGVGLGSHFRVSQWDDRKGSITGDPASGDCKGIVGNDFVLGGPDSLCGIAKNLGPQRIHFVDELRQGFHQGVVRNGGLELGFRKGAVGAPYDGSGLNGVDDEVYYTDPSGQQRPACPLAGDSWLNYFAKGQALANDGGANAFLLTKHNSANGVFTVPSYAPFSLRKLKRCRAKTITAQTTARRTSHGPFQGSDGDPAGAYWHATTTLHWKMTLHRVGRCVRTYE